MDRADGALALLKNIGANWVLTILTVLSSYVLMPFHIERLGREQYGTWLVIMSMMGYLGLLVLGAPLASVRFITQYLTEKNEPELRKAVGTFAGLYLMLGAVVLVVGGVLLVVFTRTYDLAPALADKARLAFALIVIHTAAGFIQQLPYGLMAAHRDFVLRNLILSGGLAIRVGLTLLLLTMNPSIHMMP